MEKFHERGCPPGMCREQALRAGLVLQKFIQLPSHIPSHSGWSQAEMPEKHLSNTLLRQELLLWLLIVRVSEGPRGETSPTQGARESGHFFIQFCLLQRCSHSHFTASSSTCWNSAPNTEARTFQTCFCTLYVI